nr:hypothetical transcript [Hymenolepis microstoma]
MHTAIHTSYRDTMVTKSKCWLFGKLSHYFLKVLSCMLLSICIASRLPQFQDMIDDGENSVKPCDSVAEILPLLVVFVRRYN